MGVLDDTIAIFECFSLEEPAIGQADLARRLDRPKATVHRALKSLVASG
ncbi:helix-turn-helix domain-containing protein, partial [Agrobacterium pusense]